MSLTLWAGDYWSDSCAVDLGQSLRFKIYHVANAKMAEATETVSSVISNILSKRQILTTKLNFEDFIHGCSMITDRQKGIDSG